MRKGGTAARETDPEEIRAINRSCVERYMAIGGRDRLIRHTLFTADGACGAWVTETGFPLVFQGQSRLARLDAWLAAGFPDWEWHHVRVFETRNPDHFWVESRGRGIASGSGGRAHSCDIHYLHSFALDHGKIVLVREFPDIGQKFISLGIDFPRIHRPIPDPWPWDGSGSGSGSGSDSGSGEARMNDQNRAWIDPGLDALRRANRKTVETYMATKGPDRLKRHELFVEDGCGGLWTTDTGSPIVIKGKSKLSEHAIWSLKCFPDWEWYNIEIFETGDPNHFWVECDGHGTILFPGYPQGYYENHFIHSFELDNGKIVRNREFMNVCQQLRALGIPVPEIRREGIPT